MLRHLLRYRSPCRLLLHFLFSYIHFRSKKSGLTKLTQKFITRVHSPVFSLTNSCTAFTSFCRFFTLSTNAISLAFVIVDNSSNTTSLLPGIKKKTDLHYSCLSYSGTRLIRTPRGRAIVSVLSVCPY